MTIKRIFSIIESVHVLDGKNSENIHVLAIKPTVLVNWHSSAKFCRLIVLWVFFTPIMCRVNVCESNN